MLSIIFINGWNSLNLSAYDFGPQMMTECYDLYFTYMWVGKEGNEDKQLSLTSFQSHVFFSKPFSLEH